MSRKIHRCPAVREAFGNLAKSTIHLHVSQGLLTKPVSLGPRATGWPSDEIDAILAARIAGKGEADIKSLVSSLMAARQLAV